MSEYPCPHCGSSMSWQGIPVHFVFCESYDPDGTPRKQDPTETRTTSATGGQKGTKSARFDLVPVGPLTTLARLYAKGAEKYADHNWRRGYEWSKSYAALMRHATQFWGGEDNDAETGLPHMASVAFHALALIEFMERHRDFDDRPPNE